MLKLTPEVRDILNSLLKKEFQQANIRLVSATKRLRLDPYLGPGLPKLLASAQRTILGYYMAPFTRVSLSSLSEVLGQDTAQTLAVVERKICARDDSWKLDIKDKCLVRVEQQNSYVSVFAGLVSGLREANLRYIGESVLREHDREPEAAFEPAPQQIISNTGGR